MSAVQIFPRSAEELSAVIARLREAGRRLATLPLDALLEPLGRLQAVWQPGAPVYQEACELLAGTFCRRAVEAALQGLTLSLSPPILRAELQRELGRLDLFERWLPDELGTGLVRGYPHGVVGHVLAGNVFLGGVIALAQSLLTRNAVVLKLSRQDSGFTALFARTLQEVDASGLVSQALAVCAWDSSQDAFNEVLRQQADALVVWGGAAAMQAYPAERCRGPVVHYGPRLGLGVVLDGVDIAAATNALAWDVALWEQRACSSPRVLFVESRAGNSRLIEAVSQQLNLALARVRETLPARALSLDEKAEVVSLRELAWWGESARLVDGSSGLSHTILRVEQPPHDVPLGYRTVVVVPLTQLADLPALLAPYREGLQTAVLAAPAARWPAAVDVLARAGLTQVAAAGAAAARFLGLPHEGEYALRRLVRFVGIDLGAGPLTYPGRDLASVIEVAGVLGQ